MGGVLDMRPSLDSFSGRGQRRTTERFEDRDCGLQTSQHPSGPCEPNHRARSRWWRIDLLGTSDIGDIAKQIRDPPEMNKAL